MVSLLARSSGQPEPAPPHSALPQPGPPQSAHAREPVLTTPPTWPIVLVGMPGSGKTTIARALARLCHVQVTDLDAEIRRRARRSIPQIFSSLGEDAFRRLETKTLRHVLTSEAAAQGVVALGGGAVLRPENRELLRGFTVIYLEAALTTLLTRLEGDTGRPLLDGQAPSEREQRLAALATDRIPLYEDVATMTVSVDNRSPEQIAGEIHARLRSQAAQANLGWCSSVPSIIVDGERPYPVIVGSALGTELLWAVEHTPGGGRGGVALVYARAVAERAREIETQLRESGLRVTAVPTQGTESAKDPAALVELWQRFAAEGIGRDGLVIALGGGVTTDLAGFAAASWMRGIPLINMPTTLLGMVDAAVGGKTGIDLAAGKNLVGAFHAPAAVLCDIDTLNTLPAEVLREGLGEVVKCGFIADPEILALLASWDPSTDLRQRPEVLQELIERSVAVKARVVSEDLHESGMREILNYGHTYAHAVEALSDYTIPHGETVAIGCIYAAELAALEGRIPAELVTEHREAFARCGLPVSFPKGQGRWAEMVAYMSRDKKARAGQIRMVVLIGPQQPEIGVIPPPEILEQAHRRVTESLPQAHPRLPKEES